ncbi:MAG: ABC transporter ATP-binding protein [Pyrobaculum sp.]
MIDVKNVSVQFGGVSALENVNFGIRKGEVVGLVGPNGAGKTSLLNVISGFYKPRSGRVYLEGRDITDVPPFKRAKMGIGRTFQKTSETFRHMTVLENIMVGAIASHRESLLDYLSAMLWLKWVRREVEILKWAEEVIDFFELYAYRNRPVGSLPYGLQKKVDVARAFAGRPKVLLMDEPMAGLTREEREDMARYIIEMRHVYGVTICLVEHDLGAVADLTDRVVVMGAGRVVAEGRPQEVLRDPRVLELYMGKTRAVA